MTTKTVLVLVCDLCRKATPEEGEGITSHEVGVDRKRVEVDACEACWTRASKVLDEIAEKGRRVKRKSPVRRPRRDDDPAEV